MNIVVFCDSALVASLRAGDGAQCQCARFNAAAASHRVPQLRAPCRTDFYVFVFNLPEESAFIDSFDCPACFNFFFTKLRKMLSDNI